jgi:hypothetical protein
MSMSELRNDFYAIAGKIALPEMRLSRTEPIVPRSARIHSRLHLRGGAEHCAAEDCDAGTP